MIVTEKDGALKEFGKNAVSKAKNTALTVGNKAKATGSTAAALPGKAVKKANAGNKSFLDAVGAGRKAYYTNKARNTDSDAKQAKYINKANKANSQEAHEKAAKVMTFAEIAAALSAVAGMVMLVKKMRKNDPNSAVLKEAEKRLKVLQKEAKDAQKELKKAQTPAEEKAANKKIKKINVQITKLKTQIGRLADKNLPPKEVEKVKKQLQKMVAESVTPAYTEAELMLIELQESTQSIMTDHYFALMLEAEEEANEMDDIFGEDADDFYNDFEESMDDIFGEDADDFYNDFEESAEDDIFDDFDFDF